MNKSKKEVLKKYPSARVESFKFGKKRQYTITVTLTDGKNYDIGKGDTTQEAWDYVYRRILIKQL